MKSNHREAYQKKLKENSFRKENDNKNSISNQDDDDDESLN
jgi:hypothetical protein